MTKIALIVDAADADITLKEPEDITIPQHVAPNTQISIPVGDYINTGNVAQSVKFVGITDAGNCSLVAASWVVADGSQVTGDGAFILSPTQKAALTVDILTADQPIGEKGVDVYFSIDVSHVQNM